MSALSEPIESLDRNKPVALTKSIHTFNELIKMYIGEMTGQVRKPYHGLSVRCRGDQCTYKLKTREIIADGNCLFDSLLYILGWAQTPAAQMALRKELYHHFKINGGDHNHEYDLEDAKTNKHIYASTHVLKSFVELYRRHVIVFELHNSGVFNAHIFINRTLPFHEVDFLILTQNPGHFTTFTKDRGFVQSRAFLEKILDIDSYIPGSKLRDLIVPGQRIADFNERNYTQRIFSNYDEFMDAMTSDIPGAGLAPLLPLNAFPRNHGLAVGAAMMDPGSGSGSGSRDMFASDEDLARMYANGTPKSARSRSPRSRSPRSRSASLSPATKEQIARMNALGRSPRSGSRRSGSRRSGSRRSGSGSLSPATKAEVARMNALARRRSRSASLSPATKKAIANMNKSSALKKAPNVSPATKERIARLALSEAPNASINTMNQIGRLQKRMTQRRNPLGNGGGGAGSNSPPADLRRTRRFKPSSIVGRALARPFARIFGKF